MVNLMCRGRKRGLCGIIATQRLAKLAKNVAAECANFLMGRTLLDIDMTRAADLLGMEKKKAEIFRDLTPGRFIGLGSAIARRPIEISIGTVETSGRGGTPTLVPPPPMPEGPVDEILFAAPAPTVAMPERRPPPPPAPIAVAALASAIADGIEPVPPPPPPPLGDKPSFDELIARVASQEASRFLGSSDLYQGFLQACRLVNLNGRTYDQSTFRRKLAQARAGLLPLPEGDEQWQAAMTAADQFPDEDRAVYLMLAKAAQHHQACPPDSTLALVLGSQSARRGRAILAHIQTQGRRRRARRSVGPPHRRLPRLRLGNRTGRSYPLSGRIRVNLWSSSPTLPGRRIRRLWRNRSSALRNRGRPNLRADYRGWCRPKCHAADRLARNHIHDRIWRKPRRSSSPPFLKKTLYPGLGARKYTR